MRISDCSSDVCSSDLTNLFSPPCSGGSDCRVDRQFDRRLGVDDIVEIDDRALLDQRLPQMLEIHLGHAVPVPDAQRGGRPGRSEEHTSELQSLMRISYAVFCLKKKTEHLLTRPQTFI